MDDLSVDCLWQSYTYVDNYQDMVFGSMWLSVQVNPYHISFQAAIIVWYSFISLNILISLKSLADEEKEEPMKVIVLDKIAALVTAAFGLVAALAWNDAIKAIFREIFGEADSIGPMLIYAIIVTIAAVILTIIVARSVVNAKKNS